MEKPKNPRITETGYRVNLKPMEDDWAFLIRKAYYEGGKKFSDESQPCSICRKAIAEDRFSYNRKHFHGSEFNMCQMKVYRSLKEGLPYETNPNETEVSLMDGHMHEHAIINNLEKFGLVVIAAQNQPQFEKKLSYGYTLRKKEVKFTVVGHFDGMMTTHNMGGSKADGPGGYEDVLLEIKSVRDYTWKKIKEKKEISSQWYGQIQLYLAATGLQKCYLIIKHRMTSHIMFPILIKKDIEFITYRLTKLRDIHAAILTKDDSLIQKEEPSVKASQCRFCNFKNSCWR